MILSYRMLTVLDSSNIIKTVKCLQHLKNVSAVKCYLTTNTKRGREMKYHSTFFKELVSLVLSFKGLGWVLVSNSFQLFDSLHNL